MSRGPSFWVRVDSMERGHTNVSIHPSSLKLALSHVGATVFLGGEEENFAIMSGPMFMREDADAVDVDALRAALAAAEAKLADEKRNHSLTAFRLGHKAEELADERKHADALNDALMREVDQRAIAQAHHAARRYVQSLPARRSARDGDQQPDARYEQSEFHKRAVERDGQEGTR